MLLHEFRHIEADKCLVAAEHEVRQGARDFSLAYARRTKEQEGADRTVRTLQSRAAAADGTSESADRFILRDDALVQFFFDAQEFLRLFFFDRSDRHTSPAAYHVLDVLPTDYAGGGFIEVVFFAKSTQVFALLAFFVRVEARLLELVVRDGVLHAVDDELDALLDFGQLFGQRGLAQLHAGAGLVDQIDGLVGKEAVRNIAVRMRHGEVDSVVGVGDGVELLIALFDSEQNLDRIRLVGRRNLDGLEAAFERAILFDRLAIFGGRGCADALNLAARKGRLQNVGGIERAFGRSGSDKSMQLIDEDDGILRLHQLLHDGLEALFELAAIFCAGDDQRKIEREDAFVREERRDFAIGDALGEAFDDGGLADAGLAD